MRQRGRPFTHVVLVGIALLLFATVLGPAVMAEMQTPASPQVTPRLRITASPRLREINPGGVAAFTVEVTNTGDVALTAVSVTSSNAPGCNRDQLGSLDPGRTTSYTCERRNVTESFLNTFTVSGRPSGGSPVNNRTDAFVKVLKPEIRIVKRPTSQTVTPGGTARFSIVILNSSGDTVLTNIKVTDTGMPDCNYNPALPLNLAPGESKDYLCSLTNVQSPVTGVATVEGRSVVDNRTVQAGDVAWVELGSLTAGLAPAPASIPEPGGPVTFTVNLNNTGSVPLTLMRLDTNQFGNALDPNNPAIPPESNTCLPGDGPRVLPPYSLPFRCSFIAAVSGQPSDFSVVLTAGATSPDDKTVTATTNATVVITNTPAFLDVNVAADPPFVPVPGGDVIYSVQVLNISEADTITINSLQDSILGSLDGVGDCNLPVDVIAGNLYQCAFTTRVTGRAGDEVKRTITAVGVDDDVPSGPVSNSQEVSVTITDQPIRRAFLPNITDDVVEPNDNCLRAYPLSLNRPYYFLPRDVQDVFVFVTETSGRIVVELNNFVSREGQLVVYSGECGALTRLAYNPDTALNRSLDLGTRPAGRYVIQVVNDSPTNQVEYYRLTVRFN